MRVVILLIAAPTLVACNTVAGTGRDARGHVMERRAGKTKRAITG